jgi:uncharacterized membrane protein YoaK (UPF0700 family)
MTAHRSSGRRSSVAIHYIGLTRRIVSAERTGAADTQLGLVLTFVAGATNAGGFLAIGHYTSHMSGIFSAMADHLALGAVGLVLVGLGALLAFMAGAACSAMLINWGRRSGHGSRYALPLLLEAALLLGFGLVGGLVRDGPGLVLVGAPLLCFIMGLQNATVTKISGARIRTTHVTGMVTDLGIEFGKLIYWNRDRADDAAPVVMADRAKLRLLAGLLGSFFTGGVMGALGFHYLGYVACIPLAVLLLLLAGPSLLPHPAPTSVR